MKDFRNILLVVDPQAPDADAYARAVQLAATNNAALTVAAVVSGNVNARYPDVQRLLMEDAREQLSSLLQTSSGEALAQPVATRVLGGQPAIEVIREVLRQGHDLVIKAAHRDRTRALSGDDLKLLRKCPCPLWLVQSPAPATRSGRVLLALDVDPEVPENASLNRRLLDIATGLAQLESASLHIVHAWQLAHEALLRSSRVRLQTGAVEEMLAAQLKQRHELLDAAVAGVTLPAGSPTPMLLQGAPHDVVPEAAAQLDADVVVMGTVGRTGIPGLLIGNTAERILQRLDCAIVAVKPEGFVSPVTLEA